MWPGTFHHLERLPDHDRFVVVANHSGMGTAELGSLLVAWYARFDATRKMAGMAHPAAFRVPWLGDVLRGLGAVEATRTGAAKARHAGAPMLLFPGGDHEASRPLWEADRVDFAGRKGWIYLAREHGLTILPLCITGSHKTLPIVGHGRAAAWALGVRILGVHRAPVSALSVAAAAAAALAARASGAGVLGTGAAAWAAALATFMVPWVPSAIGFHLLPPIEASELGGPDDDEAIYQRVVGDLQRTLSEHGSTSPAPDPAR